MQVTEISSQGLLREYKIVVPNGTLAGKVTERINEMAKTVQLPGFRPGKVPVGLLRKQFGQALFGEALEQSIQDGARKLLEDRGLKPAIQPKVDIKEVGEDKDLEFEVRVEVLPEIGQIDYSAISLERLKVSADDKMVEDAVARIAQASREQQPVERAAEKGDAITIDFVGSVDGVAFPGGAAEDYALEIGSGSFIPGFEDQLVGLEKGGTRDVSVTFPAEYGNKELAGKAAIFKVTCKEVRAYVAQEANDEMAKKNGFESIDAMRRQVRERIEQDYGRLSRDLLKRKLLDRLHELVTFDVPQGLVDAEFEGIWKQYEEMKRTQAASPTAEPPSSEEEEKSKAEYRAIAQRRVRLGLLLADVGRTAKVEVGNDEIGRAIAREAQRYPGQEQRVYEFYLKNEQMRESLRAPIFEDKTIDYILELSKVSERQVTSEELLKAAREGDDDAEAAPAPAAT